LDDKIFRILDLVLVVVPVWTQIILLAVLLRLYPLHRHIRINGKNAVEYPPGYKPGTIEKIGGG